MAKMLSMQVSPQTLAYSRPCLEAIFITKVAYTEPKISLEYNLHQILNHGLHTFIIHFYINM